MRRSAAAFAVRRPRRILHATDFSSASGSAFRMAVGLARREGAGLLLLHVLTPPSLLASGRRPPVSYLAVDGILRAGPTWRPDLIVIGTHGRGGVRRFLLGRVAEQVVRRASRPVLTVRGR